MAKKYPLVLIDERQYEKHPHVFLTVTDQQLGFVARILEFHDDDFYREYYRTLQKVENAEMKFLNYDFGKFKQGGLIVEIVHFLYEFELTTKNKQRIRSLMKRALNKFIHGVVEKTVKPEDNVSLDNQIIQQELTIKRAKANYTDLLNRSGGVKEYADFLIKIAEETLKSLKKLKDLENDTNR